MDSAQFIDLLAMDMGIFDNCTLINPSSTPADVPSSAPSSSLNDTDALLNLLADPITSNFPSNNLASFLPQDAFALNQWSWTDTDLMSTSWDNVPSKQEQEQQQQQPTALPLSTFTPDLSPAMSLGTPAITPSAFDRLILDEFGSSPSVGWHSPMDDLFSSQQSSQECFDFDFGIDTPTAAAWPTRPDFQLFPEEAARMNQAAASNASDAAAVLALALQCQNQTLMSSPLDSEFDYFSPTSSTCSSPTMSTLDSDTGKNEFSRSGFQPMKRRRRRRITSEEASRVVVEDAQEDTEARARYKCSVCDKTFSRPFNLRSHRATHAGVKPFTCSHVEKGEICGWSFARRHDLERHVRSRHSAEKLFACKTCGAKCGRNDAFKRHLQRHAACGLAALKEEEEERQQAHG